MTARPLRRAEASRYLHETHGIDRKPATLAKLACIGGGPEFRRAGRVPLYSTTDLDDWAATLLTPPATTTTAHDVWERKQRTKEIGARTSPDGSNGATVR